MASFATFAAAETRAYAKVKDGTWINAHAARTITGTLCVRVQRKMSPAAPGNGAWVEILDDSQV
jgi:hypothetical protein